MYDKGIAIITITRRGVETALKIKRALDKAGLNSTVYAPKKYNQNGVMPFEKKIPQVIKDTYNAVDAIVGVMATGITIRAVAPYLESKLTDPAVIGVDVAGKFVISLLSGHYGGANALTKLIADGIGATAVITTASDVIGRQSVDELAKTLHLTIQNPKSLAAVNSAIVDGGRVVLVLTGDVKVPTTLISSYEVKKAKNGVQALKIVNDYDAGVIVTREPLAIKKFAKPITILKTKDIVVGLGARKDASADSIIEAVDIALEKVHISLATVNRFATVDIKRNSPAMIQAAERLGAPLEFLSVDELRLVKHKDLSPDSEMVEKKIGVGGVCERAALKIAGENAKLILKKTKLNGVTVAIAEAE
ncbi:MAG: cobalt-precorrin 5A hydrolase [Candidatus Bathyarchaeota archaeon]|nr:cobalt-precorrin 5A hydrolase [Candidatus Bathyarchaeota archaeon]